MEVLDGVTVTEKSGAVTFIVTAVLCENCSVLVPVIVRVELPPGVVVAVLTIIVELPASLIVRGEKEAVAPAGRPVAVRATVSLKPKRLATFTV